MSNLTGIFYVILAGAAGQGPSVETKPSTHVKTYINANDVRRLSANQLYVLPPVRISGVVTHVNSNRHDFYLQDDYTGLYVAPVNSWPGLKPGDHVTVTGRARPGDFTPYLEADSIKIIGRSAMPEPIPFDLSEPESRWLDAQYVTLVADVVDVIATSESSRLEVTTARSRGVIIIPGQFSKETTQKFYRGKTVKITAVCAPHINSYRLVDGPPELHVSSFDQIQILKAKTDYAPPQRLPIHELKQFYPTPFPGSRRVRIEGTIVGKGKDELFLQDGTDGVTLIPSKRNPEIAVGRRIRSTGLLNFYGDVCQLHGATILDLGAAEWPAARPVTAEEMTKASVHGTRVTVHGTVLAQDSIDHSQPSVLLAVGDTAVIVRYPNDAADAASQVPIGATVSVTGTAIHNGSKSNPEVLLNETAGLTVLRLKEPPPFWNQERVSRLVIGLGILFLGTGAWVFLLRRTLKRQKRQLKLKAQRESELADKLRQSQKMEAIGRLAGGIAHDFNNMLTVINGSAEILPELIDCDPHTAKLLTSDIRLAGTKAAGLVAQLLTFSRQRPTQLAPINLNDVVIDCEKMLRRLIGEDVKVFTIHDGDLPPILGEPILLHQVIVNLAVNARDAMPKGGTVTIATRRVDFEHQPSVVRLSVADSGCGMTEDVRNKLFEPFFTTKGIGEGTGLGLATVYGIVQTLKGTISIDSELNVGTTFDIDFPLAPVLPPSSSTEVKSPSRITSRNASQRILLVEDDDGVRDLTTRILEMQGFTVDSVDAPDLAIEKLTPNCYSLLITDVVMPGMGGRELADRARMIDSNLRILFISGYTSDEVLRRGVQEDDVDFLNKPFSTNQLSDKVREMLSRKNVTGRRSSAHLPIVSRPTVTAERY